MEISSPSEDGGSSGLKVPHQLVQIVVLHQLEALHVLTQLATHLLLLVPDEVPEVSHLPLQVLCKVEPQDLSCP